ncbi:MAG TPA: hypothetical protein VHC97_21065 [Thermoanaerobaculia bacterium]|jgi:hypothetical protein|nr:hypothetical protein [Thermoanaerobaculia bacterium]
MSKKVILSFVAAAGFLATSASALERTTVLGSRGEIYIAKSGTYRSLFPTGNETDASNMVLAVEVTKTSSSTQRFLVPSTRGSETESSAALIYEEDSDRLFMVWESRTTPLNSVLMLASFDGVRWSNPIQITGNPFSSKSSPQLAITRDSVPVPGEDGATALRQRTILHLIWEEEAAPGNFEVLYTPVILEEGNYLGWNPIYHLSDFVAEGDSGSSFAAPLELVHAPALQNGGDPRTIVVAFASPAGRWLTSLLVDVLPEELSQLADGARANIIEIGRGGFPGNRPTLAEKAKADLIVRGTAFHNDVIRYMADQLYNQILADRGNDLVALAEKARANIIEIGARLSGRGLRDRDDTAATKARIAEIEDPQPKPNASLSHLIHFRVAGSRPTPQVGSSNVRMFVSDSGEDTLIAWTEKDRVLYRMSKDGGWTDQREIKLSDSVNLARAYEILAQRVRNR